MIITIKYHALTDHPLREGVISPLRDPVTRSLTLGTYIRYGLENAVILRAMLAVK